MRTRDITAAALVVVLALMQGSAAVLKESDLGNESCPHPEVSSRKSVEPARPVSIPDPSEMVSKDEVLAKAYWDTMSILGRNNQCSMFFGGPVASVDVFSNFMSSISRAYLPSGVGLKMSGEYINVLNAETKVKYRLFEKASLNSEGPFYKHKAPSSSGTIFGVGSFSPGSREARVLMLLHELGHLMRGPAGNWLLPDDGNSVSGSLRNTRTVESVCGEQIRGLNKLDAGPEIARQINLEQTVSPAAATSSRH